MSVWNVIHPLAGSTSGWRPLDPFPPIEQLSPPFSPGSSCWRFPEPQPTRRTNTVCSLALSHLITERDKCPFKRPGSTTSPHCLRCYARQRHNRGYSLSFSVFSTVKQFTFLSVCPEFDHFMLFIKNVWQDSRASVLAAHSVGWTKSCIMQLHR